MDESPSDLLVKQAFPLLSGNIAMSSTSHEAVHNLFYLLRDINSSKSAFLQEKDERYVDIFNALQKFSLNSNNDVYHACVQELLKTLSCKDGLYKSLACGYLNLSDETQVPDTISGMCEYALKNNCVSKTFVGRFLMAELSMGSHLLRDDDDRVFALRTCQTLMFDEELPFDVRLSCVANYYLRSYGSGVQMVSNHLAQLPPSLFKDCAKQVVLLTENDYGSPEYYAARVKLKQLDDKSPDLGIDKALSVFKSLSSAIEQHDDCRCDISKNYVGHGPSKEIGTDQKHILFPPGKTFFGVSLDYYAPNTVSRLYAYDKETGHPVWSSQMPRSITEARSVTCAATTEFVYYLSGKLARFGRETGNKIYLGKYSESSKLYGGTNAVYVVDKDEAKITIHSDTGNLKSIDLTDKQNKYFFENVEMAGEHLVIPVYVREPREFKGFLLIKSDGTSQELFDVPKEEQQHFQCLAGNNHKLVCLAGKNIANRCLNYIDLETKKVQWSYPISEVNIKACFSSDNSMIFVISDNKLMALSTDDKPSERLIWERTLEQYSWYRGKIWLSEDGDSIYVIKNDGTAVDKFDAKSGMPINTFENKYGTGTRIVGEHNGKVYIQGYQCL